MQAMARIMKCSHHSKLSSNTSILQPTGVMIGIDISYNLHSSYSTWSPSIKPPLILA